ncbi:hypothetical protein F5148DRAFT_620007 [Russula earlei]|uniref:Uncharacterized protein n=1 Tax=Russula earlei TaxID=71964 RepID=A0ACC0TUJ9_9AGAM|nr:hypothetical protein F5148DRAFT_620007 [Russula earlei]
MKGAAPGTLVPECDHVHVGGLLPDPSPDTAGPSTLSRASDESQIIGISYDTDTQKILRKVAAWPPETPEFMTFTGDIGRFLSGPGVIPVQDTVSVPQVTINDQITETTRLEQVASFDELPFGTKDQSADEQGRQDPIQSSHDDDCFGVLQRQPEPPVMASPSRSDQLVNSLTLAEAKLKFKLEPNMTLSQDPDGKLVIQELDSPITRREKAMRKKRARSKLAAPIVTASSALDGSDLSSLSELSEDDDGIVPVRKKTDVKFKTTQPGQVILEDGEMLEGGTLGVIIV